MLLIVALFTWVPIWAIDGSGTSANPYQITSAEDLAWFGQNATNKYGKLMNDIDFSTYSASNDWSSISNFSGTLDGDGHTISNFNHGRGEGARYTLFESVISGGKITNLVLSSPWAFYQDNYCSVLVRFNAGTISNVLVDGADVECGNYHFKSGLVGQNNGTIEDCAVVNTTLVNRYNRIDKTLAGLVGENKGTISRCFTYNITLKNLSDGNKSSSFCISNRFFSNLVEFVFLK